MTTMGKLGRPNLDTANVAILRALIDDPRLQVTELARRVGLSAPAARERMQRLEDAGVIAGYRVDLDPAALGLPITAYVRVRPAPGQLPRIVELAKQLPQVVECHRITGEDCFLMRVQFDAITNLDGILDQFLGAWSDHDFDRAIDTSAAPAATPFLTVGLNRAFVPPTWPSISA